jgi:hypothetical protein
MKLEIKHLAPYLPYGLKIECHSEKEINIEGNFISKMVELSKNAVTDNFGMNWTLEIKPILRPLSDLTKEIEVNGERFVPLERLFEVESSIDRHLNYLEIEQQSKIGMKYISFGIVQKLFEWHFDVFGLIEKELAININTLNLNK